MQVALEGIAAGGFARVEPAFIDGYVPFTEQDLNEDAGARLLDAIHAHGLTVHAVSAHIDLGTPDAPERLARRIGFAGALGASCLVSNAGAADAAAQICATIEGAVPALEDAGIVLALENPGHGQGNLVPDGASGVRLLAELGFPAPVRLNYDLGNAYTYHHGRLDAVADLDAALPHLAFAHLKDVAADGPHWRFVAAGTGDVGLPALVARLAAARPDLVLGLEMPLRLMRPQRADPERRDRPPTVGEIGDALSRTSQAFAGVG